MCQGTLFDCSGIGWTLWRTRRRIVDAKLSVRAIDSTLPRVFRVVAEGFAITEFNCERSTERLFQGSNADVLEFDWRTLGF